MNTISPRALIVSPYLDHLGGGERYMLEAASVIENATYTVYFAWDDLTQINKLTHLLGFSLHNPRVDSHILPHYFSRNPYQMWRATKNFDLVLYLSDGSIPLLGGKRNFLHIQVPFRGVRGRSPLTQLKLSLIEKVIVNSEFTKKHIDEEFAVDSQVIYPPINLIKSGKKDKLILSVGRFEPSLNVKKQDVLIKAFRRLHKNLPGWRLALVGTSANDEWLSQLEQQAKGLPVDFYPNLEYSKLIKLYQKARIYWHAAGYQVNELARPELTEHFGITTAEAISAGCIPLIVPKGGQVEVVPDPSFHWQTIAELIKQTLRFVANPPTNLALPRLLLTPFHDTLRQALKV